MSEEVNRKLPVRNTTVQLLTLYTVPALLNAQRYRWTERQTDGRTERGHYYSRSRSYCVQYDRLKRHSGAGLCSSLELSENTTLLTRLNVSRRADGWQSIPHGRPMQWHSRDFVNRSKFHSPARPFPPFFQCFLQTCS